MSDTCTWYVVDISTAVGPEDFVPYSSFNEALANIDAFTNLGIVWGSASADWNGDGSAPFVEINFSLGAWNFIIGIVGNNSADSGGPFADAQTALSAAQSSPFLPAGFCLSSTDPCDPNALMQAARCFACIPKGKLREVMIYLMCQWANKPVPPPVIDWVPATASVLWIDVGGIHGGNLAFFKANADLPTVSLLAAGGLSLTSLSGIITLPALTGIDCTNNKLTAAGSINQILTDLVTNGKLGGTCDVNFQTPAAPPTVGPPSGIAAKATLLTRGWTVNTD